MKIKCDILWSSPKMSEICIWNRSFAVFRTVDPFILNRLFKNRIHLINWFEIHRWYGEENNKARQSDFANELIPTEMAIFYISELKYLCSRGFFNGWILYMEMSLWCESVCIEPSESHADGNGNVFILKTRIVLCAQSFDDQILV